MHFTILSSILFAIIMIGWSVVGCFCFRAARRSARFEARWAAMSKELRDLDAELDQVWIYAAARDWRHR